MYILWVPNRRRDNFVLQKVGYVCTYLESWQYSTLSGMSIDCDRKFKYIFNIVRRALAAGIVITTCGLNSGALELGSLHDDHDGGGGCRHILASPLISRQVGVAWLLCPHT